jgi:hypothetical protein
VVFQLPTEPSSIASIASAIVEQASRLLFGENQQAGRLFYDSLYGPAGRV